MNFSVEVTIAHRGNKGAAVEDYNRSRFTTNNVVELCQYVGEAMTYFQGMVKFQADVEYVSLLVRTYRDHHSIYIELEDDGRVKVITNQ